MSDRDPALSVIVTSHTRERLGDVLSLLDSLFVQTHVPLEIIFVGDKDPDLCLNVAEYAGKKDRPDVVILYNDGDPGLSQARNLGVLHARGEIVAFLDDDVVACREWASEVVSGFRDPSVIGVTGPALPLWDDPSMSWLPEELYWLISCTGWFGSDRVLEVRNAWGMNMAFRSEAFKLAGLFAGLFAEGTGFHRGLFAEDVEFSLRAKAKTGGRILYIPSAKVWHRVHGYRLTWRFIRERAYWIGRSRRNIFRLYGGGNPRDVLGVERRLLRRVLLHVIPQDLIGLMRRPRRSCRRLATSLWALVFSALGYYHHLWYPGKS